MQNAKHVNDQLEDYKMAFIKKMKEDELEGQLIKKQVDDELAREKLKELDRRKKAQDQKDALKKANDDLVKL